jgi:3',5'-cyclic AMP phosphodiesterase CpdA
MLFSGCLGLAFFPPCLAPAAPALFSTAPFLQSSGPSNMVVTWESFSNGLGRVRFGASGTLGQSVDCPPPRQMRGVTTTARTNLICIQTNTVVTCTNRFRVFTRTNGLTLARSRVTRTSRTNLFYLYEASLTNLMPGTEYSYRAEVGDARTPLRKFRAFPGEAESVRFIAYGDSRANPRGHAALAARFRQYSPDFILHTGDLVAEGRRHELWAPEFFNPLARVIDEVPIYPVIGNHEGNGDNFLAYFHALTNKFYYSFDAGPVHVLVFDYYMDTTTSEQYRFATNDLARSHAPWKVVMVHNPFFNIGGYGSGWGHSAFLPLLHKYQVDLVLGGHSHLYERFRPIAPKGASGGWPITFITTGGGGAELYLSQGHPALASREAVHHFLALEVTRDTLRGKTIRANGTVLDSFEWKKTQGRLPDDYLAQVYPEESLEVYPELRPMLAGRAAALPTRTAPARVMFSLAQRRGSRPPAELEISLAPESAPYYILENGPLLAATPARSRSTNVWVTVRASGKKKIIEDKERNISPPLIFQAKVKAAEGETIAYGPKSRLSKSAEDASKKLDEISR